MRTNASGAAWLLAAGLLTSWAVSSASDEPRDSRSGETSGPRAALPPLSREVDAEVARLKSRAWAPPAAAPSGRRDPFSFGARGARMPDVAHASGARVEPAKPAGDEEDDDAAREPHAAPLLAGIAEMAGRGRVAIVSLDGRLHYASRGDVIAARYRVDDIAADRIDITDLVLGSRARLILQRP